MTLNESQIESSYGGGVGVKQLTIRGFDKELAQRIERLARIEGISLNQAVLRLLRKGAGLGERKEDVDVVGSSLDHLIGTWSAEEAEEIERAVADFEEIDESMWR
jgi:hypothetical protein